MKISSVSLLAVSLSCAEAFAPGGRGAFGARQYVGTMARSAVDPSAFHEVSHQFDSIRDAFTSFTLSDIDVDAVTSAAGDVASNAADAASSAVDAASTAITPDAATDATAAASSSNGWFGFLTGPIEGLLTLIHSALVAVGVSSNAWGVSIVAMTVLIKILTFPLTKTQLESTNKMQALQPTIKQLQAKYESNPEVMNQKIAEVYQQNEVNPLAGCFPSLVQIPVFIGLYRAVLTLAKENKLDEPFLWLPNLEGPVYGADPAHGSDWIFKGWTDGVPSLGWDDTIAFLTIPIFLVISQFVSMELMQPKSDDPAQQQSNIVLKFLPLMIGWFSLNVPAALGIYWVINNIITTATTLLIRSSMKSAPVMPASGGTTGATAAPSSPFTPPPIREKPSGFGGASPGSSDDIKPITPIDAEVVSKELLDDDDGDAPVEVETTTELSSEPPRPKKKRGKKRKKRKN